MNILFITRFYPDPTIGGIERVTKLLTEFFVKQGFHVYNLFFEESIYDGSLGNVLQHEHLRDKYDKVWIHSYLKSHHISIVINQSHFFYTPFLAPIVHKVGAKLITCIHSSIDFNTLDKQEAVKSSGGFKKFLIQYGYPLFKLYSERKLRKQHIASFKASDKTLLLSKSLIPLYRKELGIGATDDKLDYICNPLSFPERMKEVDLLKKENIVLVVARLYEPQKKLSLLFQAWRMMPTDGWQLIVVGDGEDRMRYEQITQDIENISFVGAQDPLPYYRRAKIFAMTSIWEGLPMTILESLQMGVVPIVMDSFPAAKDMIKNGENGMLVPYLDIKQFVDNMCSLMQNDDKRERMARKAIKSSNKYSMDEIGMRWENVFNQMK